MRILPLIALNLACLIASTGLASDIVYKHDEKIFAPPEASISIRPAEFKIADRAWAAPGVEQTTKDHLPPVNFDFAAAPRFHIEAADDYRDIGTRLRYPHVGPEWLDDVAWPLTRELYGLGQTAAPANDCEAAAQSDDSSFERKVAAGELYHVYYRWAWPKYQVAVVETSHWLKDEVLPRTRDEFRTIDQRRALIDDLAKSGYVF